MANPESLTMVRLIIKLWFLHVKLQNLIKFFIYYKRNTE